MPKIGIDALAIAVPNGYLELSDLAAARGVAPAKYTEGLLITRMSVAQPHEDAVALAANAARRLLATSGCKPANIGLCVVGTETAVDHSKPVSAYLHEILGLTSNCRTFETKHACFGGTAGLLGAIDWIASGAARGRSALVVCTDIARYAMGTAGEPTQGAGAVAMIVSANPRLVEIDVGVGGSFSRNTHDFWRPLNRKEALCDGHYSVSLLPRRTHRRLSRLEGSLRRGGHRHQGRPHLLSCPLRQDGPEGPFPSPFPRRGERRRGREFL